MRHRKYFHAINYKAEGDSDRVRTGIAAVFGNVDSVGDITHPGSFAKTLSEGRPRFKHLWNHRSADPPIAHILEIKEIGRGELPDEIRQQSPEATGGLLVAREYYDNELGNWVMKGIEKGDITEMSFGFDVINYEEKKEGTEDSPRYIRELKELKLYDTSDVLWGMNAATVAAGAKNAMPLGVLVSNLQVFVEDVKAGRRNSGSDQILINALHDISMSLGCDSCGPKEEAKSDEAEAVVYNTSLDLLKLKRQRLQLSV